jgi:hypothetical protein
LRVLLDEAVRHHHRPNPLPRPAAHATPDPASPQTRTPRRRPPRSSPAPRDAASTGRSAQRPAAPPARPRAPPAHDLPPTPRHVPAAPDPVPRRADSGTHSRSPPSDAAVATVCISSTSSDGAISTTPGRHPRNARLESIPPRSWVTSTRSNDGIAGCVPPLQP